MERQQKSFLEEFKHAILASRVFGGTNYSVLVTGERKHKKINNNTFSTKIGGSRFESDDGVHWLRDLTPAEERWFKNNRGDYKLVHRTRDGFVYESI